MTGWGSALAGVARGMKAPLRGALDLNRLGGGHIVNRIDPVTSLAESVYKGRVQGRDRLDAEGVRHALVMNAWGRDGVPGVHAVQQDVHCDLLCGGDDSAAA